MMVEIGTEVGLPHGQRSAFVHADLQHLDRLPAKRREVSLINLEIVLPFLDINGLALPEPVFEISERRSL